MSGDTSTLLTLTIVLALTSIISSIGIVVQPSDTPVMIGVIAFIPVLLSVFAAELAYQLSCTRRAQTLLCAARTAARPDGLQARVDAAKASFSQRDVAYVSDTFQTVVAQLRLGGVCYFRCTRSPVERLQLMSALADAGVRVTKKHHSSCGSLCFLESCDCSTETYDTFLATIAREHAD